jgi:hypothetical protein
MCTLPIIIPLQTVFAHCFNLRFAREFCIRQFRRLINPKSNDLTFDIASTISRTRKPFMPRRGPRCACTIHFAAYRRTSDMHYPAHLSSITPHAFVMHACAFQRTVPHTFTVFQSMIEHDRPHHDMRPCREPQRSSRWVDRSSTRASQRAPVWTQTPY